MVPESFLLPGNDCARLDEREHLLPAEPQPREPDPEETVGRTQRWARAALFIDRELMAQGDEFQLHGESGPEPGAEGGEKDRDDGWHDRQPYRER